MPTAPRGWLSLRDLFLSQDPSWFPFSMDTSVRQGALSCPTYPFFWLPSAGIHRAIDAEVSHLSTLETQVLIILHSVHCLLHCSRCTDQCLHHTQHSTGGVWLESEYLAAGKRHRWLKQVYNPPTHSGTHRCVVMLTRRWACGSGQVLKYETLVNWGCHKVWIDTEFQWKSVIFTGQGPPEISNSSHVVPPTLVNCWLWESLINFCKNAFKRDLPSYRRFLYFGLLRGTVGSLPWMREVEETGVWRECLFARLCINWSSYLWVNLLK